MDELTYGDLHRIREAAKANAIGSMEVLGPVLEEVLKDMQPKPDPMQERKHWRRVFASAALHGEITSQGLEGREVDHIAAMAYEMADAMLAHEDREDGK